MNKNANPIDWKILNAATDGDQAAVKELSAIYLRQGLKNVKKLRSAVRHQNPEQVADAAHGFLGSSLFFGATAISKPLAALMKMGRSSQLGPEAVRLLARTEKEFVRIDQFLKARRRDPPGKSAHA